MTGPNPQEGGKHTPGPWRSAPSIRGSQGERLICADDNPPLARVYFVKGQRAGANARLMAAAPDLLEALDLAVAILQEAEPRLGYAEGSLGQIEIEEAIETGLAALLQATGAKNGR